MGRPIGSKNKVGHKAGGPRKKKHTVDKRQSHIAPFAGVGGSLKNAPEQEKETEVSRPPPRREKTLEELEKEERDLLNKAKAKLKKMMEHPSNKFGQIFANDEDDDGIDYGTDTEEEDQEMKL